MTETPELIIDPDRISINHGATNIFVRARDGASWGNFDIAELDQVSLLAWLRSRGGDNPWAEDTVGIILGYGTLHAAKS